MANIIQKWKAKKRITQEVYQLVDSINGRYSQLNLNNGDFKGLNDREKLSRLIDMINNDDEISRLNFLSLIGSIRVERQERGNGIYAGSGLGLNLCIGKEGLFIYDWNDFADKHDEILATLDTLEKYFGRISAEELRVAVVSYTNRDAYIKRVADFRNFM